MKHFKIAVVTAAFFSAFVAPSKPYAADPVQLCSDCAGEGGGGISALFNSFPFNLFFGTYPNNGDAHVGGISGFPPSILGPPKDFPEDRSVDKGVVAGLASPLGQAAFVLMDNAEVWKFDGATWTQITPPDPGFSSNNGVYGGALYNNALFIGTFNSSGAQVWRLDGANWTRVTIPGFSSNNISVPVMSVYNNALYMATFNIQMGGAAEVWKFDGTTWTKLSIPGFSANNYSIASMAIYNGALYIGTSNNATGAELWKLNGATWSKASIPGLAASSSISSMAEYPGSGSLFLGTSSFTGSAGQLWKLDGTSGTQVTIPGFSANNTQIMSMATYNNSLFFGTYNTSGAEIWYLPQMQPCTATLDSNLALHIPDVIFNNQTYWADFQYDPNTQSIIFMNAGVVADTSPFSSCTPATLSPSLALHLPVVMFQGVSFRADLVNSTGLNFAVTGVGQN